MSWATRITRRPRSPGGVSILRDSRICTASPPSEGRRSMSNFGRVTFLLSLLAAGVSTGSAPPAAGFDWPQWQGIDRDAKSKETGLLKTWPAEGPTLAWKATGLGMA